MGSERSTGPEIGGTSVKKEKCTAIVVAAGRGSRMGTQVQKQFLDLGEGRPVLYYSLSCFQESPVIDEIVLVTSQEGREFCKKEIVDKYAMHKVTKIVQGGRERRDSVREGLRQCAGADYVFIHDGARPFITEEILQRAMDAVRGYKACAVGVPVKDTVKLLDGQGFVRETPDRACVWQVQTPQCFSYSLICEAHEIVEERPSKMVTDDAMAVELSGLAKVKMVMGAYSNLKITTPEDLQIAKAFLT